MSFSDARPVRWPNLIAYGVGDLYGGGSFVLISLLFIFFLTDVIGLPAASAGLVVMIGKAWDAVLDPLMGYLSDRTCTRFGRRRVYFLAGIAPVWITFALLWMPCGSSRPGLAFLYYALAYVLFSSTFAMVMVPYAALNAEMSRDERTRTRLTGARMLCSGAGSLLVGVLPRMLVDAFPDPRQGHLVMGIVFGLVFALPWILVFLGTWELPVCDQAPPARSSLADFGNSLKSLFVNRSFRVHMGMYICAYSALDILMAVVLYYMTYYLGRKDLFPLSLGVMLVTQLLALGVYVAIANRFGKGLAYVIGLAIWGTAMSSVLFIPREAASWLVVLVFVLGGMGMAAGAFIPWALLPAVVDVDELIFARQRAGLYAGAMTLLRKLVQAVVLFGVGLSLQLIGYVPNAPQSAETLAGMRLIFALGPSACILLGILFALRLRITPESHRVLTGELERLKSGGEKSAVDPATRAVCETLTGLPYERLFGSPR